MLFKFPRPNISFKAIMWSVDRSYHRLILTVDIFLNGRGERRFSSPPEMMKAETRKNKKARNACNSGFFCFSQGAKENMNQRIVPDL
jgi:hypothetical protein